MAHPQILHLLAGAHSADDWGVVVPMASGTTQDLYGANNHGSQYSPAVIAGFGGILREVFFASGPSTQDLPMSVNLWGIAIGNTSTVAVGNGGVIYSKSGSGGWTQRSSGVTYTLSDITSMAGSSFAAAGGEYGDGLTSPDGITWTARQNFRGQTVAYASLYPTPMVLAAGGGDGRVSISRDNGTTWTRHIATVTPAGAVPAGSEASFDDLIWSPWHSLWIGVGFRGVFTSPDGINWTRRWHEQDRWLRGVASIEDKLVAVGDQGLVLTSDDGALTWATRPVPNVTQGLNSVGMYFGYSLVNGWWEPGFYMVGSGGTVWRFEK